MKKPILPAAALVCLLASFLAGEARAHCRRIGGFAIDQCGDRAFFDPPPPGSGAVSAVFWQIGYGNAAINNGLGTNGVGIFPPGVFSGIDSGLFNVALVDARSHIGDDRVPEGALCLGPANWGNIGVDGCCDNVRDPNMLGPDDGYLNPYFDPRSFRKERRVVATRERVQDFPMAVLLREETGRWFAAAAVASAARDPDDILDHRGGRFTFADISEGKENPVVPGARNVVPWQEAPRAEIAVAGPAEGGGGAAGRAWKVKASWRAVSLTTDASRRPSDAYRLDNPGRGVGVADLGPLVRYVVEVARVEPGMVGPGGSPRRELMLWEKAAEAADPGAEVTMGPDQCLRVAVALGLKPRTRDITGDLCALGWCGDIGFTVTGPPACLEGPILAKARSAASAR